MMKQTHLEQAGEHCAEMKLRATVNNRLLHHHVPPFHLLAKCAIGYSAEQEIRRDVVPR